MFYQYRRLTVLSTPLCSYTMCTIRNTEDAFCCATHDRCLTAHAIAMGLRGLTACCVQLQGTLGWTTSSGLRWALWRRACRASP